MSPELDKVGIVYEVLYTHQKQKKAKTWHDGVLRASCYNKKATLFDEKGSRLDSIYISAGDITLGEQLESDRYYILVEDVKKVSGQDGSAQQQAQTRSEESTQPSIFSSDRRPILLSSQGRCSGLKKKGFVPPRMAKSPRQDPDESSTQCSQSSEKGINFMAGQTLPSYSKDNPMLSQKLEVLNSRSYQKQYEENALSMYSGGQKKDADNMVLNMLKTSQRTTLNSGSLSSAASPVANYMNQLQKVCFDSQESNGSDSRTKSPWSVYGSNNSSPKILNSPKFEGIERPSIKGVAVEPDNGTENPVGKSNQLVNRSSQEKPSHESCYSDLFHNDRLQIGKDYDRFTESNNKEFSEHTDICYKEVNNKIENAFKSKRSMMEIMKLVKGKTSPFGANTEKNGNEAHEKSSKLLRCSDIVSCEERTDKSPAALDKTVDDENTALPNDYNIDVKNSNDISELVGNKPHSSISEQMTVTDLNSNEMSETEGFDMDAGPSFSISFSPLSNVTYSDNESAQEDKTTESVIDNVSTVKDVDAIEVNEMSNSTLSNQLTGQISNTVSQRVEQDESESDFIIHTGFPKDNMVYGKENALENETEAVKQSTECKTNICEVRKESSRTVNHSSTDEGEGVDSKTEINYTPNESSEPNNTQEETCSYKADDVNKVGNEEKCSLFSVKNNDRGDAGDMKTKKENLDTVTLSQGKSAERIVQNVDENTSERKFNENNLDNGMHQFAGSFSESADTPENTGGNKLGNGISKSEESDLIDLIDNAETDNALGANTFACNSVASDEAVSDYSDRKTTQSQDTMDYSCDTLSHSSNSQQFSQSHPPEVPDMAMVKSPRDLKVTLQSQQLSLGSKLSFQSQAVSKQIPVVSETLCLGQKFKSETLSPISSKSVHAKDNIQKSPVSQHSDRDSLKTKLKNDEKHTRDRQPLKSYDPSSEENIQLSQNIGCGVNQGTYKTEAECESILTQINYHHRANMCDRSSSSRQQHDKRLKDLDTIKDWQLNSLSIPVPQFPHPSELFGRKVQKKIKECDTAVDTEIWRRENVPAKTGEQPAELSEKINEKLKGYKFSGSLCSQVSRDPYYQTDQWLSRNTFSPNPRLNDYEGDGGVSNEPSPSLFEDDGVKLNTSAVKFTGRKCVFISDSESSRGNTPQLPGHDSDDDYIYSQIYRPRPMVQDKGLVVRGNEIVSQDKYGQKALNIADDFLNSSVNDIPVSYKENYDESPPELFTQPRNMLDKQNRMYGGLHVYREKQKAALRSEPVDDQVTCDRYQNFSNCPNVKFNSEEVPFTSNEKKTLTENVNEIPGKIFDVSQESTFGYVETSSSDVVLSDKMNPDTDKFVNGIPSRHDNLNFICDNNEFASTTNDALQTKETNFSDEFSLSSQEFAQVINKSLIPKKEQVTNVTQKNFNSSSKWEKYNSQQSEEDVHLDINTLKVKVKDFSVIEKPLKPDVIFPRNAGNIRTQHHDKRNERINTNKKAVSQLPSVKEDTSVTKVSYPNPAAKFANSEVSKLPTSFSSMDSFEQMLANDNLDFSDPELDKLLQTQTSIAKIEEQLLNKSPQNCNDNKDSSEMGSLDKQRLREEDQLLTDRGSGIKLSAEEKEMEHQTCNGSCDEVESDLVSCDKIKANKTENSSSEIAENADMLLVDKCDAQRAENYDIIELAENCDINTAENRDIKIEENCDIKIAKNHDAKLTDEHNDTRDRIKSLSSESETSFSLDDSFLASSSYNVRALTESKKGSALSLRAPWKENVILTNTNSNSTIENASESPVGAIKDSMTIKNNVYAGTNEYHESAITNTSKINIESCDNVGSAVVENKLCDLQTNFMGYESEDDESSLGEVIAVPEKTEVRKNKRETTFAKNLLNKKSNIFANSNVSLYQTTSATKTHLRDEFSLSSTSLKADVRSVSSQFKNPFKNGEMPQKRTANQGTKLSKRFNPPTQVRSHLMTPVRQGYSPPVSRVSRQTMNNLQTAGDLQAEIFSSSMCGDLLFPIQTQIQTPGTLVRQVTIPTVFGSAAEYKNILKAAVTEYLNLQLYDLAKKYHHALSKVDISQLEGSYQGVGKDVCRSESKSKTPACQCGAPAKVVQVKKQGPNNGRFFYACSGARNQQCKFFQWLDEAGKGGYVGGRQKISDPHTLITHMKNQRLHFYSQCSLVSKYRENIRDKFIPKYARTESMQKKQLYLKLSHKGQSSLYSKDDIWVVSQNLDFRTKHTFIARSTYFGPTASNEVEIDPVIGYSPSNWSKETVCHALLAGNASTELSCLDNIRDHITPQSPPVIPSLLNRESQGSIPTSGYQVPRMMTETNRGRNIYVHSEKIDELVRTYIQDYRLNEDQAEAIKRVGSMFSVEKSDSTDNALLIHGVFGAGKSFLLSVIVLFLVKVFQRNDLASPREPFPWRLLISSTTNVAVDRILQGLLDLGFEEFIRVGSVKKIAKPVLPYSVHATGTDSQELRDFQEMLRSGELTAAEKQNVRQGIDKLRKGENKKKLAGVRVVGVTCASCLAACISNMQFPVVLLDECSQMTEPLSLLPIARFGCEKLLLVGDPKQLDPTIQGSEAANENGLEQTMFDRLFKMGYIPTLLRTQYRCHPDISAVSNKLFYSGMLINGTTAEDRSPLLPELPSICMYDVDRGQECCEMAGSYYNEQEAQFVVFLIQFLMSCDTEPSSIGVITLYRSQMARITDLLNTGLAGENKEIKGVQVSTVDAFQGGERDIIILSTVRTQASGFIDNDKRTNVALTRARHHLLIVGNYGNLSRNLLWEKILNHCRGFQNGIQSSDEARQQLELVLERLKEENFQQDEEINSTKISQESKKETKRRKPTTKRKRKQDESIEINPALSVSVSESSAGKMPHSKSVSGPKAEKRKRNVADPEEFESPQFSLSHSSGDSLPVSSKTNLGSRAKSGYKKSRLSDRLKPELFEDEDNDSGDDALIHFNL